MRKRFYVFFVFLIFALTTAAAAHPLGNFTVNHYSRIEVERSNIKIRAVLDMAEIPTFQESQKIDTNKDGKFSEEELNIYATELSPEYISNLQISIDGKPVLLRSTDFKITLEDGSANLPILRVKWDLAGIMPDLDVNAVHQVKFENKNNAGRIGWNEIVVKKVGEINIFNSTAFGSGLTEELKAYPGENLNAPLNEREAVFSFTAGTPAAGVKPLQNRDGHISAPVEKDRFAELIEGEITPSIILFGLLLAFGFGAMHALSPGHGKTVVGAYLVGSRGTLKHAIFLGAIVTITHTLGVFALGLLTLFASRYILPETLMPFLSFISGLLVLFIGLTLFKDRLFLFLGWKTDSHHGHAHDEHTHSQDSGDHPHDHNDAHDGLAHTHGGSTHSHLPPENISWRNLMTLGISGGLLPCPSALVLMLAAIAKGRIVYGIVLTLVFSFGLAATLTAVGLVFLYTGKFFDNPKLSSNRIIKALPVFSAFVITCVGAVICYNSIL